MASDETTRYVISILARDHVGIIADATEALYQRGADIIALSQTVVGPWFTMILSADFPVDTTADDIKTLLEDTDDWQAMVVPFDTTQPDCGMTGEPYVVTTVGENKPGIVQRFARCFADRGVNVSDVWNEIKGDKFVEIFHVTVPSTVDPKELRHDLDAAASDLDVSMNFQHQDIFTATTSLSVHTVKSSNL